MQRLSERLSIPGVWEYEELSIPDVLLIRPEVKRDFRGSLSVIFQESVLRGIGIGARFVQANEVRSRRNALRGLHFQLAPHAQGKLVRVLQGSIFEVAVDLREGSPYCGQHIEETLDAGEELWVPEGFAHGFYSIEPSKVVYLMTREYHPDSAGGIIWNDPDLNIQWPTQKPVLKEEDKNWPRLRDAKINFVYQR